MRSLTDIGHQMRSSSSSTCRLRAVAVTVLAFAVASLALWKVRVRVNRSPGHMLYRAMTTKNTPGGRKRFSRASWRFQRTFETPLHVLDRFVSTITSAHGNIQEASIMIGQVVFDAKHHALISADATCASGSGRINWQHDGH